jgi:NSS family neurotransmitter:Na+ symporter
MPNIFNAMPFGQLFAVVFFLLLVFATITTVFAVFENLIAFWMDVKGWDRTKSVVVNLVVVLAGAFPTALGFNVLDPFFAPMLSWLGEGKQMIDLFDFIVSLNILPIGSAIFVLFCALKAGWGYDNFVAEANTGEGMKWPRKFKLYYTYCIPLLIGVIFVLGYIDWFS